MSAKIPALLAAAVVAAGLMIGCDGQNMHYTSTNKSMQASNGKHSEKSDKQIAKAEKKGEYDTKAKKHDDDDDDEHEEKEHKKKEGSSTKKKEDDEKKKVASTTSKPAKSQKHDDDDDDEDEDDDD